MSEYLSDEVVLRAGKGSRPRVLVIVELDHSAAVMWYEAATRVTFDWVEPHTERSSGHSKVEGPAKQVLAKTVADAMRIASEYWAQPRNDNDRGLPQWT